MTKARDLATWRSPQPTHSALVPYTTTRSAWRSCTTPTTRSQGKRLSGHPSEWKHELVFFTNSPERRRRLGSSFKAS